MNQVNSGWIDYEIPVGPPVNVYPPPNLPDCFGHRFTFIGVARVHQQTITAANGTLRLVLRIEYDPPVFTRDTGETWTLKPGAAHPGVETYLPDGSTLIAISEMEKDPLVSDVTGERITIWGKWRLHIDAAGEPKVFDFAIYCTQP